MPIQLRDYENEIWKTIHDFPTYEISSFGQIRNSCTGKMLKPRLSEWGYEQVCLRLNGTNNWRYVHKLVASEFIPNPYNKPQVNHIDGDKLNNKVCNLEWCSVSENNKHAYETGLKVVSDKVRENARHVGNNPKTRQAAFDRHPDIKIVETGEVFESNVEVANRLLCDVQNVWACVHGKQKTCAGYHLEYVNSDKDSFLRDYQMQAVWNMKNGCILNGGVGSGKSRTGLFYYYKEQGGWIDKNGYTKMVSPKDLYIITTARKRDTLEWEGELTHFLLTTDDELSLYPGMKIVIDSWNNIKKYINVYGAFFIFDEDKVTGSGAWVKAFLKIAKRNDWIILSATPGDKWQDYIPVFVANGFYRNKTEFANEHIVYSRFTNYPKIDRYINTGRLIKLRDQILVDMDFDRQTVSHHEDVYVRYDISKYKDVAKTRWNPYTQEPIVNAAELCYVWRRIVNSDESRQVALLELFEKHPKMIIFYNFDYELEILRDLFEATGVPVGEWNGHNHQPVPEGKTWVYLVQYTAGAEGWNCIKTDTIVFYSQNYSYKILEQARGRIDRLNTPYIDLYYYHLKSRSGIDLAISKAIKDKKQFNERKYVERW